MNINDKVAVVQRLYFSILCYSFLELRPQLHFFLQLFIAIIIGIIMWQIQDTVDVNRWYELFMFSALGGLLSIFILATVGIFNKKDFFFFWNV